MHADRARATALALGLTIFLACGDETPKPAPATPGATAAIPAKPAPPPPPPPPARTPSAAREDVQITDEGVLPPEFPTDVPTYPGASPAGGLAIPGDMMSSFQTKDSVEDVYEFYRAELPKQGWTIVGESDNRGHLRAEKSGRTADIRLGRGKSGTDIAVIIEGG